MEALSSDSGARTAFAERLALLYKEAGNPPLKRVSEAVAHLQRVDERGRPVRVSAQRISDWRRAKNVPAQFAALAAVLHVLIPQARRARPTAVSPGLYDMAQWQLLWERAVAGPATADESPSAEEGPPAAVPAGVCPYRGLASYRQQDARWFFGRERSTAALVGHLRAAERTGGLLMLVGASGAGKSSLLNAGLVTAVRNGALDDDEERSREVLQLVPGSDPLAELYRRIPGLPGLPALPGLPGLPGADVSRETSTGARVSRETSATAVEHEPGTPGFTAAVRKAITEWAASRARPVIIVDQFEEAFTLCTDETERHTFIQLLHAAASPTADGDPAAALVVLGIRADFYEQCLGYPELADALQHRHMVLGPLTSAELREAVTGPAKAVGLELEPGLAELIVREVSADGPRGAHDAGVLPLLSHALLATWQRRKAGRLTLAGYRAAGGIQGAVAATAERAWSSLDPAARTAARLLLLRLVRLGEDTQATRRRGTRRQLAAESTDPGKTEESLEALVRARLVTLDADTVEITHEALLHAWPRLRDWIDEDRGGNLLRQRLEEDGRAWEDSRRDSSLLYRGSRLEQAHNWARSAGDTFLTRSAVEFLAASVRLRRRSLWISRGAVSALVVLAILAVGSAVVAWQQRNDAVFEQVVAEADRVQYTDPSLSAQLDLVAHRLRPDDAGTNNRLISIVNAPLATPLVGHTGAVYLTSFSPDGKLLATASYDRTVRLWNVADRTRPEPLGKPLTGHTSWVSSAVFSPDGRTLASAADDGTIRLWDVTDPGRPKPLGTPLTGHKGTIYLLAFSPDGRTLASAGEDRTVRLWDMSGPGRPRTLSILKGATAAVRTVAFAPDGRTLAASGDDDAIRLWDVADPRRPKSYDTRLTGHSALVHSVAFSPDGRTLASGSADDTIRLWDVADPRHAAPLGSPLTGHTGPVWSVAFSPDGSTLAAASADSTASLWHVSDPAGPSRIGEPLAGSSGEMYALGFSPDGRTLATGSGDSKVRLWSVPTSDMVGRSGAFRHDGRVLATAARDGSVRLWDVRNPDRPRALNKPFMPGDGGQRSLLFSPDGRTLAVLTGSRTVYLWNVGDPAEPVSHGPPLTLRTRFMGPDALAFSPDGRLLATAYDDRTLQLWNIADRSRPVPAGAPLTGHKGYVNALVFSPDGRTLVSGSADGTIRLWKVTGSGHATALGAPLTGHRGPVNVLALSPDGRTLASGSDDDTVRLWDVTDPTAAADLGSPLTGHTEAVVSLTFAQDGRTLASGGNDNTVRLWNVATPSEARPIGQSMSPNARTGNFLAFSPGTRMLGVSSGTDTVRLWNLDVDHAVRHICATTRNVLTKEKWQEYLSRLDYDPPCTS
ncbi:WD40 repeat domain-containing protein [Streptomyces sp. CC219B]|uniref:WD40 repeat domain-containing protein n=1 Tax=Streptomyces sp. CC219B TaxID=3044574 RepID=UPI0024A983E1|nr:WD40 repeat domain-containing protein [Streptomyces sp. CC219B]